MHVFQLLVFVENKMKHILSSRQIISLTSEDISPKVSIVIVVYNGLQYVKKCIKSLDLTAHTNYEVIVVNNASNNKTHEYLEKLKQQKKIHTLIHNKYNAYFSGANNIGAKYADTKSSYLLLLNSDTEVRHPGWLTHLIAAVPENGIISYGYANIPFRPDGWCFLISKKLYERLGGIDERYRMNWGITDLTRKALKSGANVKVVVNDKNYITHFGGKSYTDHTKAFQNENGVSTFSFVFDLNWLKVQSVALQAYI